MYDDPEFYEPDDEEIAGGWEHCLKCGCCTRDEKENCSHCGYPHNGNIEALEFYPEGWDTQVLVAGNPAVGDKFDFENQRYTVVAASGNSVWFERPLAEPINQHEVGILVT